MLTDAKISYKLRISRRGKGSRKRKVIKMKIKIYAKGLGKAEVVSGGVLFTDKEGNKTFHKCSDASVSAITRRVVRRYFTTAGKSLFVAFIEK